MIDNKGYLRSVGYVFLLALLGGVCFVLLSRLANDIPFSRPLHVYRILQQLLPVAFSMACLGLATGKWRAAAGTFATFLVLVAAQIVMIKKETIAFDSGWWMLIQIVVYQLPLVLFFVFAGAPAAKFPLIIFFILMSSGLSSIFYMEDGLSLIAGRLFQMDTTLPRYAGTILSAVIRHTIFAILVCELLNYAGGKNDGFHRRIINPGNEYDKVNGTVAFWTIKAFMVMVVLGIYGMLRAFVEFSGRSDSGFQVFMKWYTLFEIISASALLAAAAWYLRKFLLEFFFSHGVSSRFLMWFTQWPLLGFFGWLGVIGQGEKRHDFKSRRTVLESFDANGPNNVATVMMVLVGLRLLLSLFSGSPETIITGILSAAMLFWLINSISGYQFNLYAVCFVMGLLLVLPLFNTDRAELLIYYPLLALNLAQIIMVHPVLHFGSFNYISYEEDRPWQPGDDLF